MQKLKPRIAFSEKVAYGFGDLASVLYWQTFMLYFTYFYTDIFIIPASAAATMFLISRLFDGVNDPIMGMIADRTNTRWGKFRPYLLWMCVPFAISGVLVFTTPGFGDTGKIIWAYSTFILIMMLYTAINIPYTSLLGVISSRSRDRTDLSSAKFVFAFLAGIIVSATLLPMTKYLGQGNDQQGWQYTFVIYGMAAIVFFLIAFKGTRERIKPLKSQKTSAREDIYALIRNKPWLVLLFTTITFILFVAVRSSVTAHYFKYYIDEQSIKLPYIGIHTYSFETLVSAYNTIGQLSALLGVFLITWLAKIWGKKRTFISFYVVAISCTMSVFFLTKENLGWIYFLQVTGSIAGGPLSVLLWAMYADTADYGEWKLHRRSTGLVFSASTMSQKFGWAIGAYIALSLMSGVGFQPNAPQTAESLQGLIMLFTVIPACIAIVSLLIYLKYPLNEKTVDAMTLELEQRRENPLNSSM